MKKIIILFYFLTFALNANCQEIVPLRNIDTPNGAYEKDLDNELPFWVGTWKGTANNKEYTFQFTIFTQQPIVFGNSFYYSDRLMGKFKVKDLSTNQIIYDDLNISAFNDYKILSLGNISSDWFFSFLDSEENCNNRIIFTLAKIANNPNQIKFKDFTYSTNIYLDCSYQNQEDIPMFLPKVNLVLTRQ